MLRAGQRHRPEAGQREQEEADRPVGAGKPEIRAASAAGREAVDPIPGARVGDRARFALGRGRVMCSALLLLRQSLASLMSSKLQRLFVKSKLAPGAEIALAKDQAHYLGTCSDSSRATRVLLFNGKDGEWRAELTAIGRKGAEARLEHQTRPQDGGPRSALSVRAAEARPPRLYGAKGDRARRERARPVLTRRTMAERVNDRAPARQCHRGGRAVRHFARARGDGARRNCRSCSTLGTRTRLLIFADEAAPHRLAASRRCKARRPGPLAVLIGPEGGFDARGARAAPCKAVRSPHFAWAAGDARRYRRGRRSRPCECRA